MTAFVRALDLVRARDEETYALWAALDDDSRERVARYLGGPPDVPSTEVKVWG
jgi:hypothetical protein